MRTIIVLVWLILISIQTIAQISIFIPNYPDQAQRPELSYCYLTSFPVEINGTGIQKIECSNGKIFIDTAENHAPYYCLPEKLGICTISVLANENGIVRTYSKSIEIIEKPDLEFVITKFSLLELHKIFYQINDKRSNKNVGEEYLSGEFIVELIDVKNKVKSFAIWDLNGVLDFSDSVDYINFETIKKVKIKVHLYGKESDLFAGLIIKEIEVK